MELTCSVPIAAWFGLWFDSPVIEPEVEPAVDPAVLPAVDEYDDEGLFVMVPFTSTRWFTYFDHLSVLPVVVSQSALLLANEPVVPVACWLDSLVVVDEPVVVVELLRSLPIETFVRTKRAPETFALLVPYALIVPVIDPLVEPAVVPVVPAVVPVIEPLVELPE